MQAWFLLPILLLAPPSAVLPRRAVLKMAELWGRNGSQTPPPLEPGDVVRIDVQGIGSLTAAVV